MNIIGIIGAMPSELHDIRETLKNPEIVHIGKFDFYKNTLNDKTIVNVCCGVGKVNSTICTQMLIDIFKVECIINTGIAGGMNNQIKVCDIVISNEVASHDVNLTFLEKYPPYCSVFKSDTIKQDIQDRLNPCAVDMESASIGHCAYVNDIPSISIRCISDNADDEGAMSFDEFEKIAAKRVANVVLNVINNI